MIYYFTPYATDKNIGKYYNQCMELLQDNDYACFVDGDARFTTPYFGSQIEQVLEHHPHIEYATCMTNRVACQWQLVPNVWDENNADIHRAIGFKQWNHYGVKIKDVTLLSPMSGVMIILKKSTWDKIHWFNDGMLGVDNRFHLRARQHGIKLWLMQGIYIEHWYRGGDCKNKKHLL